MTNSIRLSISIVVLATMCGCADPTRPHREQLALCIVKSSGPTNLDFESIPTEMHRMHLGAAQSKRTAELLNDFLSSSPPLDSELLQLVNVYARSQHQLHKQFATAIAAGRSDLTSDELEIATECGRQEFFLIEEIGKRIDFDSLVTE